MNYGIQDLGRSKNKVFDRKTRFSGHQNRSKKHLLEPLKTPGNGEKVPFLTKNGAVERFLAPKTTF